MNIRVLIVDDCDADRMLIRQGIRVPGNKITVDEAKNAKDGLAKISVNTYDCIFIDYMLPDMDGIALLKNIKTAGNDDMMPCPIIMLTGQNSQAVMIDAIKQGAQDYLLKDNLSPDALYLALIKSKTIYDLRVAHKHTQEQLSQSRKMESLGQLTGGIAHDFNNLLTIVFGNTSLLRHSVEQGGEVDKDGCLKKIDAIERAASRGADMIKRLMVFTRQKGLESVSVNLNDVVNDLEDIICSALGDAVEVRKDLGAGLVDVHIDVGQFEQAVINMAINARDAMVDGGVLTISTCNVILGEADLVDMPELVAGEYVCLSITDNGTGMPEAVRAKIFDPFYTTKDIGKGTGLGLSMVYALLRDSGGAIKVESILGQGSVFSMYLPRTDKLVEDLKNSDRGNVEVPGGDEVILLVEDEDEIRVMNVDYLKGQGYRVFDAANGEDAMKFMIGFKGRIDLLFTDIAMPGEINGIQLAARVLELNKETQILFSTGYSKEAINDYSLIDGKHFVLRKPYKAHDLSLRIREILD